MSVSITLDPARAKRVQLCADRLIDSGQFCGVAWQFAQHSEVLSQGQSGWLDAPNGKALPADALYRIYSMTKPLVSVLALQLVEEGRLRLTDAVALYLPQFANATVLQADGSERKAKTPMLIEQLLTHRSGLSYDFLPECDIARRYRESQLMERGDRTLEALVDAIVQHPLAFEPGARWQYSVATDVLGRVLEVVTGHSLDQLLSHYLFTPCSMQDTAFYVAKEKQNRLASLFGSRKLGEVPDPLQLPQPLTPLDVADSHPVNAPGTFVRGGHGLYSTTDDYQRFLPVLLTGKAPSGERLLSESMVRFMWANRVPASQLPLVIGANPIPGYGWNLTGRVLLDLGQAYYLTLPGEGGWGGAAATYFFVHPETGLNGVVMTQYLGSAVPIADDLRTAFLQAIN